MDKYFVCFGKYAKYTDSSMMSCDRRKSILHIEVVLGNQVVGIPY